MENRLPSKEKAIRYCLECGSEMQQFFYHYMIMKTSFVKNVRLVIRKVVVTVAINKLPNYFI